MATATMFSNFVTEFPPTLETSSSNMSNTSQCIYPDPRELLKDGFWIKEFWFDVHFVLTAIIIPVGLACNVFSIGVFASATKYRRTSTGQLLMSLAFVDCLVLIGDGLRWLSYRNNRNIYYTGVAFVDTTIAGCQLVHWLRYSSKLMSSWLTVAITFERLLAVSRPLKVSGISTPRRVRILIAALSVVCLSLTAFPFWTLTSRFYDCAPTCTMILGRNKVYQAWFTGVVRVGSLIVPGILLIVCTVLISGFLARSRRLRAESAHVGRQSQMMSTQRTSNSSQLQQQKAASNQHQLTTMLIAVCVTAIFLHLPNCILYAVNHNKQRLWPDLDINSVFSGRLYGAMIISNVLATSNHAVNFFLYCLSGSAFRRQVRRACGCCSRAISERSDRWSSTGCTALTSTGDDNNYRLK